MKQNTQFLGLEKEILNIPIGPNVKNTKYAKLQREKIIKGEDLNSIIVETLELNDINLLEFLFKNTSIDEDYKDYWRENILHKAARGGLEVLQFCLKNTNIDPTATTPDGENILHFATKSGNVEAIDYILENIKEIGIDPTATCNHYYDDHRLYFAACSGNKEVEAIVEDTDIFTYDSSDIDIPTPRGYNILHLAALFGNVEAIDYILENIKEIGIDPTATTSDDYNILHFATESGNLEAIDYILENIKEIDIDPTATTLYGENILYLAIRLGNIEVMDYILKNTKKIGFDLAATRLYGENILHFAAEVQEVKATDYILENIKDIGIVPDRKALDIAMKRLTKADDYSKILEALKYLLKTGVINISSDLCTQLIQLTQEKSLDFSNSINLIQYLLKVQEEEEIKVDFSKQRFDEDLLLKMFEHYVYVPKLTQKTIGEAKEFFMKKVESNNLPKILDIFNKLAKEILAKECELLNAYEKSNDNYADLPLLIQYFNPNSEDDISGLRKWMKIFPGLEKEFNDFIESPVEANKTKLTELVFDNARSNFNELAGFKNNEISLTYNKYYNQEEEWFSDTEEDIQAVGYNSDFSFSE